MLKVKNLKALWMLVAIFGLSVTVAQAQTGNVGVNTDTPKATLDVKKGPASDHIAGIIAPYVTGGELAAATGYGTDQNSAIVYVTDPAGSEAGLEKQTKYVTAEGYYYFDADAEDAQGRWMRLVVGNPLKDNKVNWFYMPSISIDASAPVSSQTLNLYTEYTDQFQNVAAPNRSTSAPSDVPFLVDPEDLYYYVVDFDPSVIQVNSISDQGVMNYDILQAADECAFINIVFVIK